MYPTATKYRIDYNPWLTFVADFPFSMKESTKLYIDTIVSVEPILENVVKEISIYLSSHERIYIRTIIHNQSLNKFMIKLDKK